MITEVAESGADYGFYEEMYETGDYVENLWLETEAYMTEHDIKPTFLFTHEGKGKADFPDCTTEQAQKDIRYAFRPSPSL